MPELTPEQIEVARRAIEEATRRRLAEPDPLEEGRIRLSLAPAADEPSIQSAEFQKELQKIRSQLKEHGIDVSLRWHFRDAADGGGFFTGQLIIELAKIVVPVIGTVFVAYLTRNNGRQVSMEFRDGDTIKRVEGHTEKGVQRMFNDLENSKSLADHADERGTD